MKFSIPLFCIFFFHSVLGYGQADTEFWFVAPEVSSSHSDSPVALRISALTQNADVVISLPANPAFAPISVNVPMNSTRSVNLTPFKETIENKPANQVLNKGIYIRSTAPVTIYYEVVGQNNPEIFPLKGRNATGTNFFTPFQNSFNNGNYNVQPFAAFDIVATEDNTVVTIVPTRDIVGHAAGVSFTVTLNKGQTWSGVAASQVGAQRPAGTHITSNKPIAVTIKDDSVQNESCLDLTGDQMVPYNFIGTEYIVMKGFLNNSERVYVLATNDNTQIFINGSATPFITLNTGEQWVISITDPTTYITSSNRIYVLHLSGFGCEVGAPLLPSIRCTGSSTVFFTRSTEEFFGLNIMVKNGSQNNFVLNGSTTLVPGSAFNVVPGTNNEWVAAQISFNTTEVPIGATSVLTNTSPTAELFHLGIINGGSNSGARYGYFSDYAATNLGGNKTVCLGDSLMLDGGFNKDQYEWNTGDTSRYLTVKFAGDYWVRTVKEGCISSDTVTVFSDTLIVNLGADTTICENASLTLNAGSGFASYRWQNGSSLPTLVVDTEGIYSVEVANANGCSVKDSIEVSFGLPAILSVTTNEPVCEGDTLRLFVSGAGGPIYWTGPGGFQSTDTVIVIHPAHPSNEGTYSVADSTSRCPSVPVNSNARVFPSPVPVITGDPLICEDENTVLTANPGFASYSWSTGSDSSSISVSGGTYTLTVTSNDGCEADTSFSVYVTEPEAAFTTAPGDTIVPGQTLYLEDQSQSPEEAPLSSYFWDFGDGSSETAKDPSHIYAGAGIYTITHTVINSEGCKDTVTKQIVVPGEIEIPNAFSPNGDGINDLFFIKNLAGHKNPAIRIYNRWGLLVYESSNYQNNWDGEKATDGTFFYILTLPEVKKDYKGTVFVSTKM